MSFKSIVATLFIVSIAIPALAGEGVGVPSLEQLAAIEVPERFRNAPAVILLEADLMEISGRSAIHETRLVKRLLKTGISDECAFRFETGNGVKIRKIEGRAIYPDGREAIVGPRDILVLPDFEEFVLFSDQKSHAFRFPAAVAGMVMDVSVTWEMDDLTLWAPAPFQRELPLLDRRYTLIHPRDFDFSIYASHMSATADRETDLSGGKRMLVWERRDVEAIRREPLMPPIMEIVPALWFSVRGEMELGVPIDLDSWGGVADWYQRLCEKSLESGQGLRTTLDSLHLAGRSDREKAAQIFEWVRDNLRYVAIYLGDEGYRPHQVEDIIANRYGDCKDQASVLVAALRKAGIEANLVLVRTADLGSITESFPMPYYFNHAIAAAAIDGATVYLDPTCDACGFGVLPAMDQGAAALLIRDDAEGLAALPCGSPVPNRAAVSVEAEIVENGDGRATVTMELEGVFAVEARRFFERHARQQKKKAAAAFLDDVMPGLRPEEAIVDGEDPDSNSMKIKVTGVVPALLDTAAAYPLVRLVNRPLPVAPPECGRRIHPIALPVSHVLDYEIELIVPAGRSIRAAPPSGALRGDGFEYEYRGSIEGQTARFSRKWTMEGSRLPAADCATLRSSLEAILDVENTRVLVERR